VCELAITLQLLVVAISERPITDPNSSYSHLSLDNIIKYYIPKFSYKYVYVRE
jgi:hypothetical protein